MEFFLIYLYTVFYSLSHAAVFFSMIAFIAAVILTAFQIAAYADSREGNEAEKFIDICNKHKPVKKLLWVLGLLIVLACAVPDKEELAWIVGGGVTLKMVQNEEVQKLPENTAKAVNHFLESVYKDDEGSDQDSSSE